MGIADGIRGPGAAWGFIPLTAVPRAVPPAMPPDCEITPTGFWRVAEDGRIDAMMAADGVIAAEGDRWQLAAEVESMGSAAEELQPGPEIGTGTAKPYGVPGTEGEFPAQL